MRKYYSLWFFVLGFAGSVIASKCFEHGTNPCERKIKQFDNTSHFKVYYFKGLGYVVGEYERLFVGDTMYMSSDGREDPRNRYATVFVRLVYDVQSQVYYPFPENQTCPCKTIWEADSCKAKQHWFNYEKQWVK